MTKMILDEIGGSKECVVTFANTGCEHPDTLRFVDACDREWGFNTVWLEAVIHEEQGRGVTHKIVSYETAARDGEPFEAYIAKYGIPNQTTPQCTARLKTGPIESYLKGLGFIRGKSINYDTAIGIRADELDRISRRRVQERFIYPLADLGWTKQMVVERMRQFEWDLNIPEHLGNCTWCWKKSLRKHLTLAQEHPHVFDFPRRMEEKYGSFKADCAAGKDGRRHFFREYRDTGDIVSLAVLGDFTPFVDPHSLDAQVGCAESCEVYPTDGS